jgi:hypothetical protein
MPNLKKIVRNAGGVICLGLGIAGLYWGGCTNQYAKKNYTHPTETTPIILPGYEEKTRIAKLEIIGSTALCVAGGALLSRKKEEQRIMPFFKGQNYKN